MYTGLIDILNSIVQSFIFVLFISNIKAKKDTITVIPIIKYIIVKPIVAPSLSFL